MFEEFFSRSTLLSWPLVGLLLSVAFFVGVLAFVFLGLRDRGRIDQLASLPFAAEDTVEDRTDRGQADRGQAHREGRRHER